jgi:hypothetical protein
MYESSHHTMEWHHSGGGGRDNIMILICHSRITELVSTPCAQYSDDDYSERGVGRAGRAKRDLAPKRPVSPEAYDYYYSDDGGRPANNKGKGSNNNNNNNNSSRNESSGGGFLSSFFGSGDEGYYSYSDGESGGNVARDIATADRLRRDRKYTEAEALCVACLFCFCLFVCLFVCLFWFGLV